MSVVTALEAPSGISNAIKRASRATGVDFSYLLKTAARESAFNKSAKAKTSSAAGLFQFIESTWLKTVKDVGDKFGLSKYTPHIFKTRSGRYYVPNQKVRREILQLRHNPEVSAMMAGAFTRQNSEIVASKVGREPTSGELYIAHFLGAKGASQLISLAEDRPGARADRYFPAAARANRSIFYSRGRPRSVAQVYKNLVRHHQKLEASAKKTVASKIDAEQVIEKAKAQAALAEKNPASAQIALAGTKLEPAAAGTKPSNLARQVVPKESDLKRLVHTANFAEKHENKTADQNSLGADVETTIVAPPDRKPKPSIGLAGQRGAPVAAPARVAALSTSGASIGNASTTAPAGSIGVWTTIVQVPGSSAVPAAAPVESSAPVKPAEEPAPAKPRQNNRRRARPKGLLEQAAQRQQSTRRPPSPAVRFGTGDFWQRFGQS